MAWTWKTEPPQHLILHTGATFEIFLDIVPHEDGTLPAISWDISRLDDLQADADSSDVRRLRIRARWDEASFSRVFYRVEDQTLRSHGMVTLEVLCTILLSCSITASLHRKKMNWKSYICHKINKIK